MKISEEELKNILQENLESPPFGFSTKTMRLIEEKQDQSEIYKPVLINRWIMGGIFSTFILCILYSFTIDPIAFNYSIDFELPQFSVFWMWSFTLFGMAIGLWVWILLFQKGKVKI
jgi:hypothetical protein